MDALCCDSTLPFEDLPEIKVTKPIELPNGKKRFNQRDFDKLSLGQQQSILLTILLYSRSKAPLIIDQPEDNLDSEFVYTTVVRSLRAIKEQRQVIIVTHNANIAVLGDAELIIPLRGAAEFSIIRDRGSIDTKETKEIVCTILEGSPKAFLRRVNILFLCSGQTLPDESAVYVPPWARFFLPFNHSIPELTARTLSLLSAQILGIGMNRRAELGLDPRAAFALPLVNLPGQSNCTGVNIEEGLNIFDNYQKQFARSKETSQPDTNRCELDRYGGALKVNFVMEDLAAAERCRFFPVRYEPGEAF